MIALRGWGPNAGTHYIAQADYTYGPLLGLFFFGILTRRRVRDRWVPLICILSPVLCYILSTHSEAWLGGYRIGFELLLINAALTWLGLWLCGLERQRQVPRRQARS